MPDKATVNGISYNDDSKQGQLNIEWVSAEDGSSVILNKTTYTVKVSPSTSGSKNFTGSQNVTFNVVGTVVSGEQIKYAGTKLSQVTPTVFISDHKTHVDIDGITCDCSDAKLTIVVTNAAGEEVPLRNRQHHARQLHRFRAR